MFAQQGFTNMEIRGEALERSLGEAKRELPLGKAWAKALGKSLGKAWEAWAKPPPPLCDP